MMNVYRIEALSSEAQPPYARKTIGYSSAGNEYDALRGLGFRDLSLKDYIQNPINQDEWVYTASNAIKCLVYATKI
jgi:hypothetical protein